MAALQSSLPLNHFYRDTLGAEHLSQNLASNELFTPLQLNRVTVSPTRYEVYRGNLDKTPRLPWGRLREYGGLQKIQLPEEFIKPKGYPPEVVQKGHRHYGSGASDPRDLKVEQYYDVTDLHKSYVRTSDQVLPPSPHKEMNNRRIDLPFPCEHPYTSHMSRFALFPKFNTPDEPVSGDPARSIKPIHSDTPATANKVIVVNKAKGAPFRKEIQEYPHESEKEALTWEGENDFYQLMKSVDGGKQPYYPTPPKIVHPNLRLRNEDQRLELRTVNSLRNLERDQWKTTYDYNYTGNGPSNVMHIDDYHKKMVEEIKTGSESRNNDMIPATTPTLIPARPVEGRYARLYQQRRHLTADIRYPETDPSHDPPDVMDQRGYTSLPGSPKSLRRKDEWYKTGRMTADPSLQNGDLKSSNELRRLKSASASSSTDTDVQWKTMQLSSHPDHGLQTVVMKRMDEPYPRCSGGFDHIPKTVEECIKLPEVTKQYLKEYQDERDGLFQEIEKRHEQHKLELQYQARNDMHAMRNKVDQMGNRLEPKAFDQHAIQVFGEQTKLDQLRNNKPESPDRFKTGLKFTTENINDRGTITDLHDRQLDGYADFPISWRREIPIVDPPPQNHRGVLWNYISRTNPFAVSMSAEKKLPIVRSGEDFRGSRTGSILKTPGSPPRTGTSKNISFNEVVRVATSEYGSRFKMSSSPLSNAGKSLIPKQTRPSTPLPSPSRPIHEPCVYPGAALSEPALRPSSAFPHECTKPVPRDHWNWNYDTRLKEKFDPLNWTPKPGTPQNQTSLLDVQNGWSKADAHKRLHENLPEQAPDMREHTRLYELADNSSDLRFHHSIKHREKRHRFYGFNSFHFYNGNPIALH